MGSVPSPPTLVPVKLLVVEDDEEILALEARILGSVGTVQVARDGHEALARIQEGYVPDVVVTDVMMPGMDGLALARQLKRDPSTSSIPVVMLTARGSPQDVTAGVHAGARHYLTKPFTAAQLLGKVHRALGR
jgi:CheY-like chemotaxis protein